jgi:hypothetical protein
MTFSRFFHTFSTVLEPEIKQKVVYFCVRFLWWD